MIPALKTAWQDADALLSRDWPVAIRMLEIHLHAEDVGRDRGRVVETFAPRADRFLLSVHQPFSLPDGRLIDPVAEDPGLARRSLAAVEAASEIAADVEASFLVLHPGAERLANEPDARAADLRRYLERLESPVPVLLENMPTWHHYPDGRVGRTTLGRTPAQLLEVDDLVAGWCLDTSHAWGARTPGGEANVREFLPHAARILHVHASDAAPPDREGLPFGAGGVSDTLMRDVARAVGPRVACVPEIRGGHLDPRLFSEALGRLGAAGCFPPG